MSGHETTTGTAMFPNGDPSSPHDLMLPWSAPTVTYAYQIPCQCTCRGSLAQATVSEIIEELTRRIDAAEEAKEKLRILLNPGDGPTNRKSVRRVS